MTVLELITRLLEIENKDQVACVCLPHYPYLEILEVKEDKDQDGSVLLLMPDTSEFYD